VNVRELMEALRHHTNATIFVRPSTAPGKPRSPNFEDFAGYYPPFGLDRGTLARDVAYVVVVFTDRGLPPSEPDAPPDDATAAIPGLDDWDAYL
jgi:hypothetical protein